MIQPVINLGLLADHNVDRVVQFPQLFSTNKGLAQSHVQIIPNMIELFSSVQHLQLMGHELQIRHYLHPSH